MNGDPMGHAQLPVVPVSPRAAFAAQLRAQVVGWLGGSDDPLSPSPSRRPQSRRSPPT